ncbi:magnesium-translocating P-type ATPase [Candidatus Pacearchaeota archaeon]|nr:magnesium-translocating P-type ATPase [Candidatus Pacearchaeota archaeon]
MGDEYYSLSKLELFKKLDSSEKGLTKSQAEERGREFGKNVLKERDKKTPLKIFFSQFKSPLVLILIFADIISFFLGEITDSLIIMGVILINSVLGFYQVYKSEKALQILKNYITFKAKVLRDREKIEIDTKDIVPGDVVYLGIGDIVPADIRVIESQELYANESIITGESFPAKKSDKEISGNKLALTKQSNILFMGSIISNGLCKGIVVSIGEKTEFGKTAMVLSSKEPPSDFQKGISKFSTFLLKLVFFLTAFVFAVNFFLGKGVLSSLLFAVALAVGMTPELLPAIITISISHGAICMAKKSVIVKRLESIEDLGNIDVLCTDKTGTLTENKVSIENYFDVDNIKSKELLEYAAICNSAFFEYKSVRGNIIDSTILEFVKKEKIPIREHERIEDIEFDHNRRRMSSIIKIKNKRIIICKGSPISVLEICSKIKKHGKVVGIKAYKNNAIKTFEELSKKGLRIISVAYKEINAKKDYTINDEKELVFLGFITMSDPPKETTKEAIEKLNMLGVEVKVLTGDNELITKNVCDKVGLKIKGKIITGSMLDSFKESEFLKAINDNNVFTMVTPEQKYKIVSGLIKTGHITGFLGDGINDAPALKAADVGITVESAVDVAKESSDVILFKKNLDVLAEGVIEGRKTFGNSMKYILNTISANFGNMFTLSISSLYFKFIPLLPSQILLTNLVSDVPLATISTDNVDSSYLKKPKRWSIKLISKFMFFFGLISSIFDIATMALIWFIVAPGNVQMFRTVWFTESVLSEILITFSIRTKDSFWKSKPSRLLVYASIFGVALTLIAIFTPLSNLFDFGRNSARILIWISSILICYFTLTEIGKKVFYKYIEKDE